MFEQIVLEDDKVIMRPMSIEDTKGFSSIAFDEDLWRYYVMKLSSDLELANYIVSSIEENKAGRQHVFTIIDKATGLIVGSTSFGNISLKDRRVEIGWTWLGRKFQGTGINDHCKYLLLAYAFEQAGMLRVEFKTDVLNLAARNALKKFGATEEGILRSHTLMQDGRRRDTIYYSVLASEWDDVKSKLIKKIAM
ncbi:Protein N-acetyltransferase, RimJ/RimL family [Thalassolituus maritimus]|uniref:Protein N-acetyltransferase, RimJ/RimL family n=1 Tax=Thalassolituus maritimus TaxID=484498 RepID=A0A1N7Q9U4_9GAMM|nr:GNAT family protein [Thalassolituus maritimus]SIT19479.1 Protein N-acetyltransferase, RimJ/RimL family [Thalassolituus maritimus]